MIASAVDGLGTFLVEVAFVVFESSVEWLPGLLVFALLLSVTFEVFSSFGAGETLLLWLPCICGEELFELLSAFLFELRRTLC